MRDIFVYNGDVFILGATDSVNFPMAGSPYDSTQAGQRDIFIARFNNNLTGLISSTYFGSGYDDYIEAMFIKNNNVYIAGSTYID